MSEPTNTQQKRFTERLVKLLEEKNINDVQLAEKIGCSQSAISKMLNGTSRPRLTTIFKMAAALEVSPTELWPDLEVAAILDSIADFAREHVLTKTQAAALDAAEARPPVKSKARSLPPRPRP